MKGRLLPITGAALWILGLILFLIGLNIHTKAGSWMNVIGSAAFFIGLALEGVWWARGRKEKQDQEQK